jgi:hypothetical protein
MQITVVALVGDKRLPIGSYEDPAIADAVAQSWARWSGCRAAIIEPAGAPPVIVLRFPAADPWAVA